MAAIRIALVALLLSSGAALAIDMDMSGSISMGLIGTSDPAGATVSPMVSLDTRFDFSVETDGGLTIGLTVPVTTEATQDGWAITITGR